MKEYNWGMALGIITGILVGVVLVYILLKVTKTDGRVKCEYDERQTVARGKGYKYGFYTFLFYNALYAVLSIIVPKMPIDNSTGVLLGIVIAVAVNVTYCIWYDAYFSLNEHRNRVMVVFVAVAAVNFTIGIMHIIDGSCYEGGVLNFRIINFLCGLLFTEIFIILFLKRRKENTMEEE